MTDKFGSGGALFSGGSRGLFVRGEPGFVRKSLHVADGDFHGPVLPPNPAGLNLAEPLRKKGWFHPHQDGRNTCSAFCVCATAEQTVPSYSEEALYSIINQVPYRSVVEGVSDGDITRFDETGARFLAQARKALQMGALVPKHAVAYDPHLNANAVQTLTPDLQQQAAASSFAGAFNAIVPKVPKDDGVLFVGPDRIWNTSDDSGTINGTFQQQRFDIVGHFIAKLKQHKAIAAGFPQMDGAGKDIWFDDDVFETGHIDYPGPDQFPKMSISGGHSVCIVGYETKGFASGKGVFIFRNSFSDEFGWSSEKNRYYAGLPKGYGTIKFEHVAWFCLEFMHL